MVLEFVSTQPPREARAFLAEMAHIFNALFGALQQRDSAYASVLGALLELAGEKAQPVKLAAEEPLDESWAEPPVFDGCSSKGQARPGQPQPIRIVRKDQPARRSARMNTLHGFLFGVYPYICLTVFLVGSLIRFDRDQYTWKSDSSQMLRTGTLRWGSNLFHVGILFLFFGHLLGLADAALVLRPLPRSAGQADARHRTRAAPSALLCFVGLTMLIYRRIFDPRIRYTSHRTDIAILHDPVGAAGGRPDHAAVLLGALRRQRDADPGRLGAAHPHLAPRRRRSAGRRCRGPTCSTSCSA